MFRRLAVLLSTLLFSLPSHALRPEYWDFMWFVSISTVCRVHSDQYQDTLFAQKVPLSNVLGNQEDAAKACLRRLKGLSDSVCAEIMNVDLTRFDKEVPALREKYGLEAIEIAESMNYIKELRESDASSSPVPRCPADARKAKTPVDAQPLADSEAVCQTDVKLDPTKNQADDRYNRMTLDEVSKLAEEGDAEAQNEAGRRYGLGLGVSRDPVASAKWYQRAADQGFATAQANLAYMYLNGEGVKRDDAEARRWARKSADQGNSVGQLTLGYIYGVGKGVEPDGRQAERCYRAAALQGDIQAQQTLVNIYARGEGVPADQAKAALWLKRLKEGRRTGQAWHE